MDFMNSISARARVDTVYTMALLMAVAVVASVLPEMVLAVGTPGYALGGGTIGGDSNAIEQVMCNVVMTLTGTTGKAVATVAVIAVGVGALLGKISWGMALIVALGIALIFGAASIVTELGGTATACTTGTIISS